MNERRHYGIDQSPAVYTVKSMFTRISRARTRLTQRDQTRGTSQNFWQICWLSQFCQARIPGGSPGVLPNRTTSRTFHNRTLDPTIFFQNPGGTMKHFQHQFPQNCLADPLVPLAELFGVAASSPGRSAKQNYQQNFSQPNYLSNYTFLEPWWNHETFLALVSAELFGRSASSPGRTVWGRHYTNQVNQC